MKPSDPRAFAIDTIFAILLGGLAARTIAYLFGY
jgi:hypothetical protein